MRVAIIRNNHQAKCGTVCVDAVYHGLREIGVDARFGNPENADVVVCWGWRRARPWWAQKKHCLVVEHGYFGNRNQWLSLGWNGLNGYAFFNNSTVPDDRWLKLWADKVRPWRHSGEYILLCGQVPGDMSLQGRDIMSFYPYMIRRMEKEYRLPVVWRPHPVAVQKGKETRIPGYKSSAKSLEEDLANAALVACWNSNAAVDAVINGIPAMVMDKGAMAWEVAARDFSQIIRPDLNEWGRKMAYTQWTIEEIKSGEALRHIWRL